MHKKMIVVKTIGSRDTGDLRPDIPILDIGVNINILSVSSDDKEMDILIWSSDNIKLRPKYRCNRAKLDSYVTKIKTKVKDLSRHPMENKLKPKIINGVTKEVLDE